MPPTGGPERMPMTTLLPPEWAAQSAVMLTWPRADGDFGRLFSAVESTFFELAHTIARFEALHINVDRDADGLRQRLIGAGVRADRLRAFELPNNDV